jgi:hypothetical protein
MTPIPQRIYLNMAAGGNPVRPRYDYTSASGLVIPRGALCELQVQAVNRPDFSVDSSGYAESAARFALSDFTGSPLLALKTGAPLAGNGDFACVCGLGAETTTARSSYFAVASSPLGLRVKLLSSWMTSIAGVEAQWLVLGRGVAL